MLHKIISSIFYRSSPGWGFYREIDKSQYHSTKELQNLQFQKLLRLIKNAEMNSHYWSEKFSVSGVSSKQLRGLEDIQAFPILNRDQIKSIVRADSIQTDHLIAQKTGGSSGEPITIYSSRNHMAWQQAAVLRSYNWLGYIPGNRRARLFAAPTRNGVLENTLDNRIKYWLANNWFIDVSSLTEDKIEKIIASLQKVKPQMITGYTSCMAAIARKLIARNETLGVGNLRIANAAEPISPKARSLIEAGFGGILFDHYGTREIGYIADECEERNGLHIHMEYLLVEIVDKNGHWVKEGEEGEILITELENCGMPIIRYRIGDMAVKTSKSCQCGRGLQKIPSIIGRVTDTIVLPNGERITGIIFPHILKDFPIKEYQIIQKKIDHVEARIVLESAISEEKKVEIENAISKVLHSIVVDTQYVQNIDRTKSGKLKSVISEIQP